jgi:hypothetical protein
VHRDNFAVYGARKVWLVLNREGIAVARCTVEWLVRAAGLAGACRGKVKKTTIANPHAHRADDLVARQFAPTAPDRSRVRRRLRLDLVGVGVHRVRDGRLRPAGPGLAGGLIVVRAVSGGTIGSGRWSVGGGGEGAGCDVQSEQLVLAVQLQL